MGINHVCPGLLAAIGIQLPAVQSEPQGAQTPEGQKCTQRGLSEPPMTGKGRREGGCSEPTA